MKPPAFLYAAPRSLDEALAALREHGSEAKVLAGGQSLVPMMNLRLAEPRVLIDLNRVPELAYLRCENGSVRVGAMARHRAVEGSGEARRAEPLLARVAREIGHLAIRSRGTVGGSLAHADPAAEWPLVAVLLDAPIMLRSTVRSRSVPAREFFVGPLTTAAEPDEILTEIAFPSAPAGSRFGFAEVTRRPGDFAIVAVACRVTIDASHRCRTATLAVAGVHDTPLHVPRVERALVGSSGEDGALREAAAAAAQAVEPASDVHGSAAYRRRMVAVLARRALREAFDSAEAA